MRIHLLVIAALVPNVAAADPSVATEAHPQGGLFVQITPGVGVAAAAAKLADGSNLSLAGVGGTFDLELGATIADNFIIAADVSATSVVSPTLKKNDMELQTKDDVAWGTAFLGGTAAYYVMPLDLRIAAGLGAFRMAIDAPNMPVARSDFGGAAKLAIGKEWWVSSKWGLGVNVESVAGYVPDDALKDKGWGFFSLDLALSATYR